MRAYIRRIINAKGKIANYTSYALISAGILWCLVIFIVSDRIQFPPGLILTAVGFLLYAAVGEGE